MMHIKEPLLLIGKSSPCGGSGFPISLSQWSFIIYQYQIGIPSLFVYVGVLFFLWDLFGGEVFWGVLAGFGVCVYVFNVSVLFVLF